MEVYEACGARKPGTHLDPPKHGWKSAYWATCSHEGKVTVLCASSWSLANCAERSAYCFTFWSKTACVELKPDPLPCGYSICSVVHRQDRATYKVWRHFFLLSLPGWLINRGAAFSAVARLVPQITPGNTSFTCNYICKCNVNVKGGHWFTYTLHFTRPVSAFKCNWCKRWFAAVSDCHCAQNRLR
jgi:hypothetical protein